VKGRFVVNRYLLARRNIAQGDKEDVVVDNLHVGVGRTGVVDIVGAVSTLAAIEAPAIVDCADAQLSPPGPAISFRIRNFLAGVFRYFPAPAEVRTGKASLTFNG
jgi:hypothetical protein